jgi:hypothetical protein
MAWASSLLSASWSQSFLSDLEELEEISKVPPALTVEDTTA